MGLSGAILGDIAGSYLEENWSKDIDYNKYQLFNKDCCFTDDTVTSLGIKYAIDNHTDYTTGLRIVGQRYPYCGWGKTFNYWMFCKDPYPYNSFGNGAAMRVSYIGQYYDKLEDVRKEARKSAFVSHNHKEGVKGAVTTASLVWMAKNGYTKEQLYDYMLSQYPQYEYKFSNMSLNQLRQIYSWDVTCQTSVPVAMRCFLESDSYESFLRNVFSIFCDSDTIACIGGGIAEEHYKGTGFDNDKIIRDFLPDYLYNIYKGDYNAIEEI